VLPCMPNFVVLCMRVLCERTVDFEPHEITGVPRVRTPSECFVAPASEQWKTDQEGALILELGAPMHAKRCGPVHEDTM